MAFAGRDVSAGPNTRCYRPVQAQSSGLPQRFGLQNEDGLNISMASAANCEVPLSGPVYLATNRR